MLRQLEDYVLELARGPRVCFLPTAQGDDPAAIVTFYERARRTRRRPRTCGCSVSRRAGSASILLAQDAIYVAGGNTANMLAVWRVHGIDEVLREAWEAGIVLCGWSAGANCWFEASVTDSYGPELEGMSDGLGLLAGSFCPHYNDDSRRRRCTRCWSGAASRPGYAAEDGVALHFEGRSSHAVVSAQEDARGYRVDAGGETPLETRLLA